MNRLIVANLVRRPVRSFISVIAIALEVTLILVIVGFCLGMLNDNKERTRGTGADIMVKPPGSSIIAGMTGAPLPVAVGEKLRKLPHVQVVSPVFTQYGTAVPPEIISGIDLKSYEAMRPFHYLSGGPFQDASDLIVDDLYAAAHKNAKVGDKIDLLNQSFTIRGIVEHGKGSREYVPIATLQELTGLKDKASFFYLKLDNPRNAERVKQEIKDLPGMATYSILSMEEWLSLMTASNIPALAIFLDVVIGVAVTIGFIVIFQSMYTAVIERTREIGILKSLGASKAYIVLVVLRETLLLAIAGAILGIALSYAITITLVHAFPALQTRIIPSWVVGSVCIALGGSLLGAFYPALQAAQKDPVDALAYE